MQVLSSTSKENLIKIARETLETFVRTGSLPTVKPDDPTLWERRSCFVTLKSGGKLRGCVGTFRADHPLFQEVMQMTRAASCEDFRFVPVPPEELEAIEIEISVLSGLEKIHSPSEIETGRHGVYLLWKGRSGAFLPEVAEEMGWTAEEFVKACGREKTYLPDEAWPEVTLYRFMTEKIKEKKPREA